MRYFLFCLMACVVSIGMSSCKKCWECEIINGAVATRTEICDQTQKQIKDLERSGTGTATINGEVVNRSTTCKPKK